MLGVGFFSLGFNKDLERKLRFLVVCPCRVVAECYRVLGDMHFID